MLTLHSLSVSRSVRQASAAPLTLTVLAVFDNAVDFIAEDGRVVALVTPRVGNGPLNIVVDADLSRLALPSGGSPGKIDAGQLIACNIHVDLRCPEWDPKPDWDYLRAAYHSVQAAIPRLLRAAHRLAPARGLLALFEPRLSTSKQDSQPIHAFHERLAGIAPHSFSNPAALARISARLAGFGPGLTPAGDDWLAGLLAWAWLASPDPHALSDAVMRAAAPRTTTLSAAFLRCAALGELDEAWHDLLYGLASDRLWDVVPATQAVLRHGATSGADTLAGFLYPFVMNVDQGLV